MIKLKKMEALYFTGINKVLAILIPKINGKGYLKSPFGGHHCNQKYSEFSNLNLENIGDVYDIDGYVSIGFRFNVWDDEYEDRVKLIMESIVSIFPQCTGFKEANSSEFWSIVTK